MSCSNMLLCTPFRNPNPERSGPNSSTFGYIQERISYSTILSLRVGLKTKTAGAFSVGQHRKGRVAESVPREP